MLGKVRKVHMIGIGGIGMSGIAEVLLNLKYEVSGSDIKRSKITERLETLGARIFYTHDPKNVEGADVIVISSAIKPDNPEILKARELRIPVIPRTEMLSELMRMKFSIAVSGSHGKTTTTSLIGEILAAAGMDPTLVIGGRLKSTGTNARLGSGKYFVAEVDESDGTFRIISPVIAVVTSIDKEHLDTYKTLKSLKLAFLHFLNAVPFWSFSIACIDDKGVRSIIPRVKRRLLTYGMRRDADFRASKVKSSSKGSSFKVTYRGKEMGNFFIPLLGVHNVVNALAAICVAEELGIPMQDVKMALENFSGIERRLEFKGVKDGVYYYDDYGHHPTEIIKTLSAVTRHLKTHKLHVIFQPHRFTRTSVLMEEFARAFSQADTLIVMDIYPAGESPIEGVNSEVLVNRIKEHGHPSVYYVSDFEGIKEIISRVAKEGDIVLTLGAGDVYKFHEVIHAGKF